METNYLAYAAHQPGLKLELTEFSRASLGDDEIEISVEYCGLCQSDIAMLRNDWGSSVYPLVPGHEVVGVIRSVGKNVPSSRLGSRVGVGWYSGSCGYCGYCLSGRHSLCLKRKKTIVGSHGGFANSIRCNWKWATKIPKSMSSRTAGPLFCAGLTVYQAMLHSRVRPSMHVGVIGIGGLGHIAVQFLKRWGCFVTVFTSSEDKAKELEELGVDRVIQYKNESDFSIANNSLDWLLNTTHVYQDTPALLDLLVPGGTLHYVGISGSAISFPISSLLAHKSITASTPGSPAIAAEMLDFAAQHNIEPIIEVLPLSKVNEAISRLLRGEVKYRFVLKNDIR